MSIDEEKERLIEKIVDRELEMFMATPNEGGTTCTLTQLGEGTITITVTVFGVSDSVTVFALNMPS